MSRLGLLASLAAIALLACSGAQSTSTDVVVSGAASASPSQTEIVVAPSAEPSTGEAPSASAAVTPPVASTPGLVMAAPPPAHSVSSASGAPAGSGMPTAIPGAAPPPAELELIAICKGTKSMFTDKELKLLKLADASSDPAMREKANDIRLARQDALKAACDRLRAAGKL